ncbi:MAG: hypothetical protein P9M03_11205 [Candidatus Theseobacter exili]|nr:hypothetical protein [Candidatus Theseobacter exili]
MKKNTKLKVMMDNAPFGGMLLIGALTIASSFLFSTYGIIGAISYILYGILGSFWLMIFVCPYCHGYGNDGCPSGYGKLSAKMVKGKEQKFFAQKFRKHIPAIVPLWIIPVICGAIELIQVFSWLLLFLVIVFIFDSWVILPMLAKQNGCAKCPQKKQCPWMKQKQM